MIKNMRESNFELLRIVSMFMIISFHYVYKSGYSFEIMNLNSFLIKLFWFFGELGVNLFVLITGYFLINQKMKMKKFVLIVLEVFFYNLLNVLLDFYFAKVPITINDILFPVIFTRYWFATAYLIIYLLSPYMNKFVNCLSKNDLIRFLSIVLLIWCVIPTIFGLKQNSTESLLFYSRFIWLTIMYLIGAYIRLYDIKWLNSKKKSLLTLVITFAMMAISVILIYKNKVAFYRIGTIESAYLWTPNNIFMLILSISVFQFFAKLKMKSIKMVNILASTTLGIYLLHDGYFSKFMWENIFQSRVKLESDNPFLYIIGTSILIFIVGTIIDLIRKIMEKQIVNRVLDWNVWEKIKKGVS